MREFSSYGAPETDLYYYVPRRALVNETLLKLVGKNPQKGGHYMTIWAPRQCGKTWVLMEVLSILRDNPAYKSFDIAYVGVETLKFESDVNHIAQVIARKVLKKVKITPQAVKDLDNFEQIFSRDVLKKPLILVIDEVDSLAPQAIAGIVGTFRNIHTNRRQQSHKPSAERDYLLHGVALIGVRAVLGIENKSGSPFNVQQSIHIPNLTFAETEEMYQWYERESGQQVEQAVIERVFYETNGQPGLVSWLGELLTVKYNKHKPTITLRDFKGAYAAATRSLPNANVINIISKANQEPYKQLVLKLFQTKEKIEFLYEDPDTNFLYMNGVIDEEVVTEIESYIKFPSPFIQRKLFNYFSKILFRNVGQMYNPFDTLEDVFTPQGLHLPSLLKRYEVYLKKNSQWLFKEAPRRRHDLRIYEAVYHFNFYMYLYKFIRGHNGQVWPEFPTGNGKIDIMIKFEGQVYGLELKSFANLSKYKEALTQAAAYAHQLKLKKIALVFFIEAIDDQNRTKLEVIYTDPKRGITVKPSFVVTGWMENGEWKWKQLSIYPLSFFSFPNSIWERTLFPKLCFAIA